jgi:O-antigen ligase
MIGVGSRGALAAMRPLRRRLSSWWLLVVPLAVFVGDGLAHRGKIGVVAAFIGGVPAAIGLAVSAPFELATIAIVLLGLYSEEVADDTLFPGRRIVYAAAPHSAVEIIFYLLLAGYVLRLLREGLPRAWPGAPATASLALALAGVTAVRGGSLGHDLRALRDVTLLFVAILVGYWLSLDRGPRSLYRVIVYASVPMIPLGLYNVVTGSGAHSGSGQPLSFYDGTSVFILGTCLLFVAFDVVDIGPWRYPYLVSAAAVAILSLRRGAILSVLVALLITLVWTARTARSRRWTYAAGLAIAAVSVEAVAPGLLIANVGHLVRYVSGASGTDWSVNYRDFERPNVWINVRNHWLWGVGPSGKWTLWNSFNNRFVPLDYQYVHNNFLWAWLHFGILGLMAFGWFIVTTAWTLLRRPAQDVAITIVGASVVGMCLMFATASPLTTTVRWPLFTGMLVGIACAQLHLDRSLGRFRSGRAQL